MDTYWDPNKARTNFAKHGVAFDDAETALTDPLGLTRDDPDTRGERRFVTVGADALGRVITVVHTYRGDAVRLISARPAIRKETDAYAKGI
ncbi:MAG: BrnT family toxin [Gammaproteobacteria bacterium]|nr:BrnT family toxin [Gammaproteobacteria bacterium]